MTTLTHVPAPPVHQPAPYERWLAAQTATQNRPYQGRHRGLPAIEPGQNPDQTTAAHVVP